MNLFVLGWNLPQELSPVALAELRQMTEVYPQLDPEWMNRYVRLQRSSY